MFVEQPMTLPGFANHLKNYLVVLEGMGMYSLGFLKTGQLCKGLDLSYEFSLTILVLNLVLPRQDFPKSLQIELSPRTLNARP